MVIVVLGRTEIMQVDRDQLLALPIFFGPVTTSAKMAVPYTTRPLIAVSIDFNSLLDCIRHG
jgi:hypothetical protein